MTPETLAKIHQLYGAQSHFIDDGHAGEWAATFSADGEFVSPTYPAPVRGTADLTAFARRFFTAGREAGERSRHVLTNVFVAEAGADTATVHAYLQIVTTPVGGPSRLARQATITDELVVEDGEWRIRRRVVKRDDADGGQA